MVSAAMVEAEEEDKDEDGASDDMADEEEEEEEGGGCVAGRKDPCLGYTHGRAARGRRPPV